MRRLIEATALPFTELKVVVKMLISNSVEARSYSNSLVEGGRYVQGVRYHYT